MSCLSCEICARRPHVCLVPLRVLDRSEGSLNRSSDRTAGNIQFIPISNRHVAECGKQYQ